MMITSEMRDSVPTLFDRIASVSGDREFADDDDEIPLREWRYGLILRAPTNVISRFSTIGFSRPREPAK